MSAGSSERRRTVTLVFMGASRLVMLLERFHATATSLGVELKLYSLEDNKPWHAIGAAGLATLVPSPSFTDKAFPDFIVEFCRRNAVDAVIPNIDKAVVALSHVADRLRSFGVIPFCASVEVCETMSDKVAADRLFKSLQLPVPAPTSFPWIAKPRNGSSSRGLVRFSTREEYDRWAAEADATHYTLQRFVTGVEYSIDGYVDGTGALLGLVSRVRDLVSDGEVMVSHTHRNARAEAAAEKLVSWNTWHGPFTVQFMEDQDGPWIIECNPRFGSGVTLSIEAGLDVPRWMLSEVLKTGRPERLGTYKDNLFMSRARKDYFLWL